MTEPTADPEPQPLPEGHPIREEWVRRIASRSLNDKGSPTPSIRQSERQPPDWTNGPWIRRREE